MKKKKLTAWLVLVALLVTMFPILQSEPEPVLAANQIYVEGVGIVTVQHQVGDGYTISLDKDKNLIVQGRYFTDSSALISYHTTKLYFTKEHSNKNPGQLVRSGKGFSVDVTTRHTDGGEASDPKYRYDIYTVDREELEDMISYFYGKDGLKTTQTVYLSEGFQVRKRDSASIPWDYSHLVGETYDSCSGIQGAEEWSTTTYYNFANYYDIRLTLNLVKHNITIQTDPPGAGNFSSRDEAFVGDTVEIKAWPVDENKYTFSGWTVESGGAVLADAGSADTTFKMPNNDVVLTANFKEKEVPAPTKAPVATPTPAPTLKPGQTPSPAPTAVPTPTPEPTPTPKPYVPSSSFSQTRHVSRYYSTDAGYTINRIYEGDVPSKDDDFGYVSSEAEVDVYAFDSIEETRRGYNSYKEGTDAKGNIWYFMDDGTNATYVHPKKYNGYLVDSDDIRFITELTFPGTLTYLGTTYTVTSIGGGTQYYMYPGRYSNSYETNSYGPTCNSYELENSYNSSATYEYLRWERGRVLGVIGNGEIYSLGNSVKRYYSSAVSTIFSTGNSYYVYNTTLECVTIPSTVTRIESYAFYNCQALKKVIGGSGVTVIDESAFSTTTDSYRQLHLSKTTYLNPTYNSYNYDYYYYNGTFGTNATGVNATMTAWRNSTMLADYLELPVYGSLQIIGEAAFRLRTNLYDVTLPGSVTEIDEKAFYGCTLNSITLPGTGVTIYDAPETLGTKGNVTQKTQIITEPYSKAMNYGLKYEDYYEVRAGYKTTYNNNQSPQETYVSTTIAKKVSREIVDECDVGTYLFFIDNEGDLWRKKNQGNDELPTQLYAGTKFRSLKKLTGAKGSSSSSSSTYFYGCVAVAENGKVYGYSSESRSWTDLKVPQGSTNHQWTCLDFSIYNASSSEVYSGGSDTLETVTYLYYLYDGKIYRKKVFLRSSYASSYSYASGSSGSGGGSDYSVYYSSTPTVMSASGTNISEFYVFPSFTGSRGKTTNPSNEYKSYTFRLPKVIASDSSGKSWVGDGCYKGTYYYYYASGQEQFYDGYTSEIYAAGYEGVSYVWSLSGASGYRQIFASKDKTRGDTTFNYKTPGSRMSETHESSYDNVNVIDKNGNLIFVKDIMSQTASSNCIGAGSATTVLAGKNFVEVIPTNSEEYMLLKDASGNIWAYFITRSSAPKLLFSGADVVHTWKETTVDEYSGCCYYYHNLIVYDSMGRYWRVSTERYYDYASGSSSWYSTETASISNPGLKPNLMTVGYDFIEPLYDNMFRTYGKEFLGWNTKANGSGTGYQPGYELKLTAPMTLYAQWGAAKNIVRYAPNGGSGIMEEDEYESSVTKVTLSANTFTRKGYEFTGWNTKADGTGTSYGDKATVTIPKGTTTLYAQWKPITYVIKVGTDDIREEEQGFSQTVTLSTDQTFTVPGALADKTYTLSYQLNHQASMSTVPSWKSGITTTNTKASLAFYGWRLYEVTAEGYKYLDHYEPGEVIKNLTSTKNATLILFPYWGGSASYVKLPEVDCVGYDLVGFTTGQAYAPDSFDTEDALRAAIESNILIMAPNGSGAQYQPKKSETLYAYYQAKSFIVELDGRGATEHTQTTVTMTFDEIGPDVISPEKTGYTFHGYYTGVRGTGKQYFDATGTGTAVWREKKTDVLYAYWTQDPVIIPGQDTERYPEVPQTEQLRIEAALDASTVHIYADDNNPSTDALTDKQPYQVSDIIIDGETVAEGAIPSTENVALRAKMGAWMFTGTLERVSGTEYVRMHVTVPYRTQYEDAEDETLIISEVQTKTIAVMVPKEWSYWVLKEGGLYFPEKVTVENAALEAGIIEVPVTWDCTGAVCKPDYRLTVYGGKGTHVTWSAYDSDDVPSLSIVLTEEEYIISDTPGIAPDVTEHLTNVCHNAAWQDTTQFTVKSDHISVAGLTVLSDAEQATGAGKVPDLSAVALLEDKIEETSYTQTYESGIPLLTTAKNGRHETAASIVYKADEANIGTITELVIPAVSTDEINVHTPVVCIPEIEAFHEDMYQCAEVPEECTVLVLDETGEHSDFVLRISNSGFHSERQGYGEREYSGYVAKTEGKLRNEVKFPFDTWVDAGNDKDCGNDVRLDAGEWYVLGEDVQRFYLPVETTEGIHEIQFRAVAVNGCGEEDKTEEFRNEQTEKYVAVGSRSVYVTGRLYDFTVYEVGGSIPWEEAGVEVGFTVGREGTDGSEWKTLPLRTGVHPDYQNVGGLAMGGFLCFRVKSIGISFGEGAICKVYPQFVVVTEQGYREAEIYFEEKTEEGVFLKKWEDTQNAWWLTPVSGENGALQEWQGSFSLPEKLFPAEPGADVSEYQAVYGLDFTEDFWIKDATIMLRFAFVISNTQGEQLHYGRIPDEIGNNIWKKEAEDDYRYDNKGNRYEIQGGEVAVIYPGDDAGNGYGVNGIY